MYRKLVEKAGYVMWHYDRKEYFVLISRSGFTDRMKKEAKIKGVLLLTLEDYMPDSFEAPGEKGIKITQKRRITEDKADKIMHRHRKAEISVE